MDQQKTITVETIAQAPMEKVWEFWKGPEHIVNWAIGSDDWETPAAENDLRVGGKFKTVMAAKDKSSSFDFMGVYTEVKEHKLIEYDIVDGRHVRVEFTELPEGVKIVTIFEPYPGNSDEMERGGWQAILNNFKKYAEANK
jgi:uncharacterized protein YndB with AHSA1/START domain